MSYCTRFLHVRRLSLQLLFLVRHGQIGYDYLDTRSKLSQGLYSSINVCIPIAPPYTILVGAIVLIRYIEDSSVLLKDKNKEVRKKKFHYCDPLIIIPRSNYVPNIIYHHILENGCPLLFIPSSTQINNSRNIMMENIVTLRPSGSNDYMICLPAHGAVIGAWFGAWPMPLDWDRPWQV